MKDLRGKIKKLYYKIFKRYQRTDYRFLPYHEADDLIKNNEGKPEHEQWVIAKEEDYNTCIGFVHLERRERILE
ncbi:MAG: hypothetical protein ABIB79_00530 [archaeon]